MHCHATLWPQKCNGCGVKEPEFWYWECNTGRRGIKAALLQACQQIERKHHRGKLSICSWKCKKLPDGTLGLKKKKKKKKATISLVVSSPPQAAVYPEGYWRVRGTKINRLNHCNGATKRHITWLSIKAGEASPWARKDSTYSSWVYPLCFLTYMVYDVYLQRNIFIELNHKILEGRVTVSS